MDRNVLTVNTIARGNAAEAAVLQAFAAAGISVLIPFGSGLSFDLAVVMPGSAILRVQVKCGRVRNGCVEFKRPALTTVVDGSTMGVAQTC
jgi:hypothetical protein